ncbi:DUF1272 domain-containing protein [Kineococcus sp. NUM-3379]
MLRGRRPDSPEAVICSSEDTFCRRCVEQKLLHRCLDCRGGFAARPVRPVGAPAGTPRQPSTSAIPKGVRTWTAERSHARASRSYRRAGVVVAAGPDR